MNSRNSAIKRNGAKPHLRTVANDDPTPAEDPPDTYLVNSRGEAERAPTQLENKRFSRPGGYLLYLGIAIAILMVLVLIGMV